MTCIVGLEYLGKAYIGADSYVGLERLKRISTEKIFRVDDRFLLGLAGRFRPSQIVQYNLKVRPQEADESDMHYMVCGFAEALRSCLQEFGAVRNESGEEGSDLEGLVAYNGKIYHLYSDYSILRYDDCVASSGDGSPYALAAMMALIGTLPAKECLLKALDITSRLTDSVCPPFYVECI
jgi:ATP-dependent protease HslVU (ClpYQ) peptidase subunit